MDKRYRKVSQQLVDLGYNYILKPDSLLLVEKLLNDLIETTTNLEKYMCIAQQSAQEYDNLQFGTEPYKCDNEKLLKECLALRKALANSRQLHASQVATYKNRIAALEKDIKDHVINQKVLQGKLKEVELQAHQKSVRLSRNEKNKSSSLSALNVNSARITQSTSAMALSDQKIRNLTKQVAKLKEQQLDLCTSNEELKNRLGIKEAEIQHLRTILANEKSMKTCDCCLQGINYKLHANQDEIAKLHKSKMELELQLKDSRCKQHEAMKRALSLAERNAQLEHELQEIDQVALSVEQECNFSVKSNNEKVKKMQEKLQASVFEIQDLEKQLSNLKLERERILGDLEACRIEKRHMQSILESTIDEKKGLSEKINKFLIIERDLNEKIDELVQERAEQKRSIADLNGQLLKLERKLTTFEEYPVKGPREEPNKIRKKSPMRSPIMKMKHKKASVGKGANIKSARGFGAKPNVPLNSPASPSDDELDYNKENTLEHVDTCKCSASLQRFKSERDFYIHEFKTLKEKLNRTEAIILDESELNAYENSYSGQRDGKAIKELKEEIINLRCENQNLSEEKHNLLMRLENVRDYTDPTEFLTIKSTMKRFERERDLLKADLEKLEEERNSLKYKLKLSDDMHNTELQRFKMLLDEREEQVRKLEKERYDSVHNQSSRKATISSLEEQCEILKEQLKSTQNELTHQKTIYSQLTVLHEQMSRSLTDSENQLMKAQQKVSQYEDNTNELNNNKSTLQGEIQRLKDDLEVARKNLIFIEKEKDELLAQLDRKTEKLANAEDEIESLRMNLTQSERDNKELQDQLGQALDNSGTKDLRLKSTVNDISVLKRDLEEALRAKEIASSENKRLQNELAACTVDIRRLQNELMLSQRQVEDLKRQSQHYVAEVKRIEDLMTQKEIERSEMLDQFRTLSHEASSLENNNHTLVNEAQQSKLQLSVALDHADELEKLVEQQKSVVYSYESKISDLTTQFAMLERKLKQNQVQQDRYNGETNKLKDLCAKLDEEKDTLKRRLEEKKSRLQKADDDFYQLRKQYETIEMDLKKEQKTSKSIETILGETRRQLVEQQLLNEELRAEILGLKNKIRAMEQNLLVTTDTLDTYQEKAVEYSRENKKLRREIVDQNFDPSGDGFLQSKNVKLSSLAKSFCGYFSESREKLNKTHSFSGKSSNVNEPDQSSVDVEAYSTELHTGQASTTHSKSFDESLSDEEQRDSSLTDKFPQQQTLPAYNKNNCKVNNFTQTNKADYKLSP